MNEETPPETPPDDRPAPPEQEHPDPAEHAEEVPSTEPSFLLVENKTDVPEPDGIIDVSPRSHRFQMALPSPLIRVGAAIAVALIIVLVLLAKLSHKTRQPSPPAVSRPPVVVLPAPAAAVPVKAVPMSSVDQLRSWIDSLGTVPASTATSVQTAVPSAIAHFAPFSALGTAVKSTPAPAQVVTPVPVPIATAIQTSAAVTAPAVVPVSTSTLASPHVAPERPAAPEVSADTPQSLFGISGLPEWKGTLTGVKEFRTVVIKNESAWKKLWHEHRPRGGSLPQVDFEEYMVVGVFGGEKPAGTSIAITNTEEMMPPSLVVSYREKLSSADAEPHESKLSTRPYSLWVISQSSLPVRFEKVH